MVGAVEAAAVRDRVAGFARDLDPALLSLGDASAALVAVTAAANALATVQGQLAKRVADTGEWKRAGHRSAADHLAAQCGTSPGRAKQLLDTAERLETQPEVAEAARAGALSAEQAARITDAAAADPSASARLIDTAAASSLKELGEACDRVKAAADPDPDATHERTRSERALRFWSTAGVAKLFAQTTPEQMATIKAAVESRAGQLFEAARKTGRHEPREAYLMDALEQICSEWMSGPTESPAPKRKPAYLGLIRIDHGALQRGRVEGDELCEITGLGPVPVRTARELLGDAVLHLILTNGTAVGTTVNLKRGPTVAQRMALLWSSPICAIDGCPVPRVEIDHGRPWTECRETSLANLRPLCGHHHDLKTYDGWAVIDHDGQVLMVPPDDPRHPNNGPPP